MVTLITTLYNHDEQKNYKNTSNLEHITVNTGSPTPDS